MGKSVGSGKSLTRVVLVALATCSLLSFWLPTQATAATRTWEGDNSNYWYISGSDRGWGDSYPGYNWSKNTLPADGDTAKIIATNGKSYILYVSKWNYLNGAISDYTTPSLAAVNVTGYDATNTASLYINRSGSTLNSETLSLGKYVSTGV